MSRGSRPRVAARRPIDDVDLRAAGRLRHAHGVDRRVTAPAFTTPPSRRGFRDRHQPAQRGDGSTAAQPEQQPAADQRQQPVARPTAARAGRAAAARAGCRDRRPASRRPPPSPARRVPPAGRRARPRWVRPPRRRRRPAAAPGKASRQSGASAKPAAPAAGDEAGEQHQPRVAEPLAEQLPAKPAADRGQRQQPRAEPGHRRIGVQVALQVQRAPQLQAALDHEGETADQPQQQRRPLQPPAPGRTAPPKTMAAPGALRVSSEPSRIAPAAPSRIARASIPA